MYNMASHGSMASDDAEKAPARGAFCTGVVNGRERLRDPAMVPPPVAASGSVVLPGGIPAAAVAIFVVVPTPAMGCSTIPSALVRALGTSVRG